MEMKPGMRLTSIACDTEVMIIKVGAIGKLTCGGHEMCSDKDRPSEKTAAVQRRAPKADGAGYAGLRDRRQRLPITDRRHSENGRD